MKLYIKHMVSARCKIIVAAELKKLGLHCSVVDLGEVQIQETMTPEQHGQLKASLLQIGLELMDDKKAILIERIKNAIVEMVHHTDERPKENYSIYPADKLKYDYTYLANLFSEATGTTIEHFIIAHKIEKVKELLKYDELNLTEISYKLNYCSLAHLSCQFKKVTGFSPSGFKKLMAKRRNNLETLTYAIG